MKKVEDYLKAKQIVQEYEKQLNISDVICSDCLYDKPFYMTSRSGNKVDYNPFGYKEYK